MDVFGKSYDSYGNLEDKILAKMKAAGIPDRVMIALMHGFDAALGDEVVILDRKKRKQLFAMISGTLLEEVIEGLEDYKT